MKQVVTKRLETERLYLDKGTIEDYLKVHEYDFLKLRDIDGEFKYEKQNLQEIKDWFIDGIEKFHQNNEKANVFEWIIYLKNNQPIGNIFTHTNKKDNNENSTEIAYNLHPKYWGKGYMPEATKEVLNFLFKFGYEKIFLVYSDGNIKSKKVSEKLGFELYKKNEQPWFKNGKAIYDYKTIMTKEKWYELNPELQKIKKLEKS